MIKTDKFAVVNGTSKAAPEYDPYNFGERAKGASTWATVLHIFFVSTGPGLLTFPSTFNGLHNVTGSVITLAVIWLYLYSVKKALKSEYELCKLKQVPYLSNLIEVFDVHEKAPLRIRLVAQLGRALYYLAFVAVWFGYNCYYYRLIARNTQLLYDSVFGEYLGADIFSLIFFVPLLLLCWIRKFEYMLPFSILGGICNFLSVVFVVYYVMLDTATTWEPPTYGDTLTNVPILIGAVLLNINALGVVVLLKNDMKNPRILSSKFGILNVVFVPVSILTVLYSISCNLQFGAYFGSTVFRQLPKDEPELQFGTLIGILGLILQYPLTMFVPFDTIWNNFCMCKKNVASSMTWEYGLRTLLVILVYVICSVTPMVTMTLSLFGTVGATIESLMVPAFMETLVNWKLCDDKLTFRITTLKNFTIVIFAVWVVASLVQSFMITIFSDS